MCNFHKNALRRHWYDLSDAEAHKCLLYVCNGCLNHVMPSWLLNTCKTAGNIENVKPVQFCTGYIHLYFVHFLCV